MMGLSLIKDVLFMTRQVDNEVPDQPLEKFRYGQQGGSYMAGYNHVFLCATNIHLLKDV